jgi:uncharacterized ferredoxin-like protein
MKRNKNRQEGLTMNKSITISLYDCGKYVINAKGFAPNDDGLTEALMVLKESEDTLKEAFKQEMQKLAHESQRNFIREYIKQDRKIEKKMLEGFSESDITWLKQKFGTKDGQ